MMASTAFRIFAPLRNAISNKEPFFVGSHRSALPSCILPHQLPLRSAGLSCSSRRRGSSNPAVTSKKNNKNKADKKNVGEDEIDGDAFDKIDEDAFDALFSQLEEDLKNDELFGNGDGDDDLNEEDLAKLEQVLAEALEDDELVGALNSAFGDIKSEDEDEDDEDSDDDDGDGVEVDDEEEEEEESPIKLRSWQVRRLAYALKKGRRKTSIKNLAAELCLDRAVVLKLLRDPPPSLVMMSATLPDKPEPKVLDPVERRVEQPLPEETTPPAAKPEVKVNVPVHEMQSNWSARKRLKKVQVETLEQVYKRTKRPTNAIVSSIVHVTNLPRRRVVKWFEEKRAEEGIPDKRLPYQRSASESVFTS